MHVRGTGMRSQKGRHHFQAAAAAERGQHLEVLYLLLPARTIAALGLDGGRPVGKKLPETAFHSFQKLVHRRGAHLGDAGRDPSSCGRYFLAALPLDAEIVIFRPPSGEDGMRVGVDEAGQGDQVQSDAVQRLIPRARIAHGDVLGMPDPYNTVGVNQHGAILDDPEVGHGSTHPGDGSTAKRDDLSDIP